MRILIYLLLAGVVLFGMAYGIQLIWRAYFPASHDTGTLEGQGEGLFSLPFLDRSKSGRYLLWAVLFVFALMVMDRVWVDESSVPVHHTPLPTVQEYSTAGDRYY